MNKWIKRVVLSLMILLAATGCGDKTETKDGDKKTDSRTITCKLVQTDTTNGYKLESEYVIYGTKDVVDTVKTKENVTSDKAELLTTFESTLNSTYKSANTTYGGYTYKVTKDNDKVVADVTIDYSKMDLNKYVEDNSVMKQYVNSDNKLLIEGVESIYKSLGATCEESK